MVGSRDSSARIAIRLRPGRPEVPGSTPGRQRSRLFFVYTGSRAHRAEQMGIGDNSAGIERAKREADHFSSSSTEPKNA
jgi:hypothetical protein